MSPIVYTPIEEIPQIHATLVTGFANGTGKLSSIQLRKNQLLQLGYVFKENIERWQDALEKDLGRPKFETSMFEISAILNEVVFAYNNINAWTKPGSSTNWDFSWTPFNPKIRRQPVGIVLIITPFNFPLWTMGPLVGAIAAGCPAVVKPSELTPATSSLVAELFPKYLDQDLYRVVNGGVDETTKLLGLKWDHILYTGSGRVGRIVATAAAQHLTPTTLELGGKCPVFIDSAMDLKLVARRLLWGKLANAGQTCIAPDYALVPKSIEGELIREFEQVHKEFYPDGPKASQSFGRIISDGHFNRLIRLLEETKGTVVFGGDSAPREKYIAPTLVKDVSFEDSLMQDEIFGPILPLVSVKDLDESLQFVNSHDRPLALYIFTNDTKFKSKVLDSTHSGSVFVNDVVLQGGCLTVPFGGIGSSGTGSHKGKFSFDTFTHARPTLHSPKWIDYVLGFRFPPYTPAKFRRMSALTMPSMPAPRPTPTGAAK